MKECKVPALGYLPSLDGMRAIAVGMVMLAHANFQLGLNGGIGVGIFFTLSGFLITTLLLEEYSRYNHISLKAFYIRRTMRLFPALYAMLFFVFIYTVVFRNTSDQSVIFDEIKAAALYVYNISWSWGWGTNGILLYHMWSLGVEEQFYLLWPLFLIACIRFKVYNWLMFLLPFLILVVWLLKSFHVLPVVAGDVICECIFIGCVGAIFRRNNSLNIKFPQSLILALFGLLIVIGVGPFAIPSYHTIFNVSGIFTILIILYLSAEKESVLSRFLSQPIFVFIGKVSYSLYLWHLPIFRLFATHSTLPSVMSFLLKFVVSFMLAVLSWFFIEKYTTNAGRNLSAKLLNNRK